MPTVVPAEGVILERILDTMPDGWREGLNRRALGQFHAAQGRTEWATGHQRRLTLMDGRAVLASAERRDVQAILDGRSVRVVVIASAFADPDQRGRGHARTLVERVVADATHDGADLALIVAKPVSPGLETAAFPGFDAIPRTILELGVTASTRHGAPMTLVRGGEDRDLSAVAAMGQVRASAFRFHLDRDVDVIKHAITRARLRAGLAPPGAHELLFAIAEEGITAAAYVVLSTVGGAWTIRECGDRDPSGARVGAILQALIARDPSEERPVIRAWLPAGFMPPQVTARSRTPAEDVLMVRSLTPAAAFLPSSGDDSVLWPSDFL